MSNAPLPAQVPNAPTEKQQMPHRIPRHYSLTRKGDDGAGANFTRLAGRLGSRSKGHRRSSTTRDSAGAAMIAFFAGAAIFCQKACRGWAKLPAPVKSLSRALGMSFKTHANLHRPMPSSICCRHGSSDRPQRPARVSIRGSKARFSLAMSSWPMRSNLSRQKPSRQCSKRWKKTSNRCLANRAFSSRRLWFPAFTQKPIESEAALTQLPEAAVSTDSSSLSVAPPAPGRAARDSRAHHFVHRNRRECDKSELPDDGGKLADEMKQLLRRRMIAPPVIEELRWSCPLSAQRDNAQPVTTAGRRTRRPRYPSAFGSSPQRCPINQFLGAMRQRARRRPGACEL